MKDKMECPHCDGIANLQQEATEITYRKKIVTINAYFYKCEKCAVEFTTTEADTGSLAQLYDQ